MPEKHVASYLPSAFARPDNERVFLGARWLLLFDRIRNTVLSDQPLPRRWIDQSHVDEAAMLPTELLKSSVRNERIDQLQLSI